MAITTTIHGKYLGTIFNNLLKCTSNTDEILKCQQWQYLLRKLNSCGVSNILNMFYYSFIKSVFTLLCCTG